MAEQTVRWGIIGAGIIAHKMADAIRLEEGCELVAVASRTAEKAEAFAREYDIAAETYPSLVERADVDVIYIATTHNFHADNAAFCLEHGKHVVVEKPFTVNATEARRLQEMAEAKGCFLMEAIWTRFLPSMIKLRETLQNGTVGEVKVATVNFGGVAPEHYRGRLLDPALAGGVTLDMGIYPVSMLCYALGEVPSVNGASCRFSDTGVDEVASYQLSFPSGCLATVNTSFNLLMPHLASFYGDRGYIEYPHFQNLGDFTVKHLEGAELTGEETIHTENAENGFVYQAREAARCIREGLRESPVIPVEETVRIMDVLDEIRRQLPLRYDFESAK
ncbi:Gfo/Idh/MocA family protein [Marinimicrobium agarilyticum]|uniref:Gfo/Idh/MocA family protein n=1 Tax=Marinimicrobium agarilyticum TaxID=306546 RepID=UPI0003FE73BC|nr:Gfo/Idh/MocA family oxidoreductase [Marinimicrobium agarilyticum]